jgi:hypothetical protein
VAGSPIPERAPSGPSARRQPPPSRARRLLREPLVHFAILGGLLMAIHTAIAPSETSRRIEIDDSVRNALRQDYVRRTGAQPSAAEEQSLVDRYVDDEILYREALALGLDRGDIIVRRRLLQKMEFLAEEAAPLAEPSDAELERYLAENAARYAKPPRVALTQVYLSSDRHGPEAEARARELRSQLAAGADPAQVGDPFPRGRDFGLSTERDLAGIFGTEFAAAAMKLPAGEWSAPVRSSYGWHLVRPSSRSEGGPAPLADVRAAVRLDLLEERRAQRRREALDALRARYEVVENR